MNYDVLPNKYKFLWRVYQDGTLCHEAYNLVTTLGQKNTVGLWFGSIQGPTFIGLESAYGAITAVTTTSVTLNQVCGAIVGDTLVLSVGTANQEVTSAITGISGAVYSWATATTKTHAIGDIVERNPALADTTLISEVAYSPVIVPNTRRGVGSTAFASGVATAQWFFNGAEAQFNIYGIGTFDNATIGQGNLWNRLPMNIQRQLGSMLTIELQISTS